MQRIPITDVSSTPSDGKIYVRLIKGRFQTLRRLISWPMMTMFFLLCWVRIDGDPVLMFSFSTHRIVIFGLELSWYDLQLLGGVLIASATFLFFLSMLAGRVWCGFACPQSVWTWLFIRVEDFLEGKAARRAKEDKHGLQSSFLMRRVLKHVVWGLIALATAVTFCGYFTDIYQLSIEMVTFELPIYIWGWLIVMAALTYLNAGLVREKICLHACPYSRFQSVMLDTYTRVVTYDEKRGEPRTAKRHVNDNSGACVDCTMCVQVCPTGIDIRKGLQAACINCGACVDACDSVMSKLSRPLGLIKFTSEAEENGLPYKLFRPLLFGYLGMVIIALSVVAYGFTRTTDLLVEFNRERGAMYSIMGHDEVCNFYKVKAEAFNIDAKTLVMSVDNTNYRIYGKKEFELLPGDTYWRSVRVCTDKATGGKADLTMRFSAGEAEVVKRTTFFAPRP